VKELKSSELDEAQLNDEWNAIRFPSACQMPMLHDFSPQQVKLLWSQSELTFPNAMLMECSLLNNADEVPGTAGVFLVKTDTKFLELADLLRKVPWIARAFHHVWLLLTKPLPTK
jgi:hypothetical protein